MAHSPHHPDRNERYVDWAGDEIERLRMVNAELLCELQDCLSWLSSYPGGVALKQYESARAAIAKATGESA